ncbi:type II toxin-antitoxin system RelE/ParE family toxin, partial [Pseudomonas amygdali]
MNLFWTPEAIQDREDIYNYIEADNPTAALDLDELFEEKAMLLVEHPNLGRLGRVRDTSELIA